MRTYDTLQDLFHLPSSQQSIAYQLKIIGADILGVRPSADPVAESQHMNDSRLSSIMRIYDTLQDLSFTIPTNLTAEYCLSIGFTFQSIGRLSYRSYNELPFLPYNCDFKFSIAKHSKGP